MNNAKLLSNITLNHALEWQATNEKFTYICDTFDLFANQGRLISLVESYMNHLLKFQSFHQDEFILVR